MESYGGESKMDDNIKYEISTLLYMEHMIDNSINLLITDIILRGKEVNYEDFKESVNYILDEEIRFIIQNRNR